MIRTAVACIAVGLLGGSPAEGQEVFKSAHHDFRVVTVADGLVNPWSMAWLPGGDMLITERPGRLRIVRHGTLLPDPVAGVPEVFAQGQGGLFDVLPHPDFASNRLLYLNYARRREKGRPGTVRERPVHRYRGDLRGDHRGPRTLRRPSRVDHDGFLFLTVGERQVPSTGDLEAHPAQDLAIHAGTHREDMTSHRRTSEYPRSRPPG